MDVLSSNCYGNKEFENKHWYVACQICICWSNMLTTVFPNKKIVCSKINTFFQCCMAIKGLSVPAQVCMSHTWFLLWICFRLAVNLYVIFFLPYGHRYSREEWKFSFKMFIFQLCRGTVVGWICGVEHRGRTTSPDLFPVQFPHWCNSSEEFLILPLSFPTWSWPHCPYKTLHT